MAYDFVVTLISFKVFIHEAIRDAESDFAVDAASFRLGMGDQAEFVVGLVDADRIVQKFGVLCASMGDKGLVGAQFKAEFASQEGREFSLERLRFRFRSNEPQDEIIGVAQVFEATIVGVLWVT